MAGPSKARAAPMRKTTARMPWLPIQPPRLPRARSLAEAGQRFPVKPVGGEADDQGEQELGQELGQPHESQEEGAPGERVDLPAHGHGDHRIGQDGGDARAEEERQGAAGERRSGGRIGAGPRDHGGSAYNGRAVSRADL